MDRLSTGWYGPGTRQRLAADAPDNALDLAPILVTTEEGAQHLAATIPGAALLSIPDGGHLAILTHRHLARPVLEEFLANHAPLPV